MLSLAKMMRDMEQSEEKQQKYPSKEAQFDTIKEFLDRSIDFKVGDRVALTPLGKQKYRYPCDKQVAVVSNVFSEPRLDNEGCLTHGCLVVVHESHLQVNAMDFRFLKKSK